MVRIQRNKEELDVYILEIIKRQWSNNPITVSFAGGLEEWLPDNPYDFNKEYIKVVREGNHETIYRIKHDNGMVKKILRYPHIFNYYNIPEKEMYI